MYQMLQTERVPMSRINQKLTDALPGLPNKLARATRYALDNPDRIAFDSMRTVASACDVASPTMLRLARARSKSLPKACRNQSARSSLGRGRCTGWQR